MNTETFSSAYNASRNGCDHFIRHPLVRKFAYSDGVAEVANTGCHWLLDILATELPAVMNQHADVSNQCIVHVVVKDSVAHLRAEMEDDVVAWQRTVDWTDLPDGEYKFLIANDGGDTPFRMILITEY